MLLKQRLSAHHASALQLKIHPAYFWSSYFVYDVLDWLIDMLYAVYYTKMQDLGEIQMD